VASQKSFRSRTSGGKLGKIRVFIYGVKRTVATLLTSLQNAASALTMQGNTSYWGSHYSFHKINFSPVFGGFFCSSKYSWPVSISYECPIFRNPSKIPFTVSLMCI
jgi:hypothetical protein